MRAVTNNQVSGRIRALFGKTHHSGFSPCGVCKPSQNGAFRYNALNPRTGRAPHEVAFWLGKLKKTAKSICMVFFQFSCCQNSMPFAIHCTKPCLRLQITKFQGHEGSAHPFGKPHHNVFSPCGVCKPSQNGAFRYNECNPRTGRAPHGVAFWVL